MVEGGDWFTKVYVFAVIVYILKTRTSLWMKTAPMARMMMSETMMLHLLLC